MTGSITDCAFIGVRGYAGNGAVVMGNGNSTGVVARIQIIGCMVDCSANVTSSIDVWITAGL